MTAIVLSDAAVGDADGVFREALKYLERRLGNVRPLDSAALPADRAAAIAALDAWAGNEAGKWRLELVRWYEAHAPVLLRPDPAVNAQLRGAARAGTRIAVASPLPAAAVELYLSQLGVRRSVELVFAEESGDPVAAARAALDSPDAPYAADAAALGALLGA